MLAVGFDRHRFTGSTRIRSPAPGTMDSAGLRDAAGQNRVF